MGKEIEIWSEKAIRKLNKTELMTLVLKLHEETESLRQMKETCAETESFRQKEETGEETESLMTKTETGAETAGSSRKGKKTARGDEAIRKILAEKNYRKRFHREIRGTISLFLNIIALAVIVALVIRPVLKIYGDAMSGTLDRGQVVLSLKTNNFKEGDLMAVSFNGSILVRRVIGVGGDWINIDDDGVVYVNNEPLDEPYLADKSKGSVDIEFPHQVQEGRYFIMADNRQGYEDSRLKAFGDVSQSQIIGKVMFRVWPLSKIGTVT